MTHSKFVEPSDGTKHWQSDVLKPLLDEYAAALDTLEGKQNGYAPKPTAPGSLGWDPTANGATGGYTYTDLSGFAKKTDINDTPVDLGTTGGQFQIVAASGTYYLAKLNANLIITGITGSFGTIRLSVVQDAAGGHVVSFPSTWQWNGGVVMPMPLAGGASADYIVQSKVGGAITVTQVGANYASTGFAQQALNLLAGNLNHCFEFDTTSGNVLTDYSPNGYNATINGTPTLQAGPVAVTDPTDQSIQFRGQANENIVMDGHQFVSLTNSWGLVVRAELPSSTTATNDSIYMAASTTSANPYFQFLRSPSASTGSTFNRVRLYLRTDQNSAILDVSSTDSATGRAATGVGHLFFVTFEAVTAVTATVAGSANVKLYIDGQLDISTTVTIPAGSTFTAPLQTWGAFRRYDATAKVVTASTSALNEQLSVSVGATRLITPAEVAQLQTVGA